MAEITNAQVVSFSDVRVRPIANRMVDLYLDILEAIEEYNVGDIGTKINDGGSGNFVGDTSASDGRPRITGGDIFNSVTAWTAFKAYVEGAAVATLDRSDVIYKPHTLGN